MKKKIKKEKVQYWIVRTNVGSFIHRSTRTFMEKTRVKYGEICRTLAFNGVPFVIEFEYKPMKRMTMPHMFRLLDEHRKLIDASKRRSDYI
jgi:hypothetical protein